MNVELFDKVLDEEDGLVQTGETGDFDESIRVSCNSYSLVHNDDLESDTPRRKSPDTRGDQRNVYTVAQQSIRSEDISGTESYPLDIHCDTVRIQSTGSNGSLNHSKFQQIGTIPSTVDTDKCLNGSQLINGISRSSVDPIDTETRIVNIEHLKVDENELANTASQFTAEGKTIDNIVYEEQDSKEQDSLTGDKCITVECASQSLDDILMDDQDLLSDSSLPQEETLDETFTVEDTSNFSNFDTEKEIETVLEKGGILRNAQDLNVGLDCVTGSDVIKRGSSSKYRRHSLPPILSYRRETTFDNGDIMLYTRKKVHSAVIQKEDELFDDSDRSKEKPKSKEKRLKRRQSRKDQATFISVACQTELTLLDDNDVVTSLADLRRRSSKTSSTHRKRKVNRSNSNSAPPLKPVSQDSSTASRKTSSKRGDTPRKKSSVKEVVTDLNHKMSLPAIASDQDGLYSSSDEDASSEFSVNCLPSVGPPSIVRYQREPDEKLDSLEDLTAKIERQQQEQRRLEKSLFSGPCQYCKKQILPLPTNEELTSVPLNKLFCCDEYENFIRVHLSKSKDTFVIDDIVIDISPSEPYGTKAARKAARERAAERMREREIEKQRAAVAAAQANFFSFTRQMKTIQYSLSSPKCMDEGWTIKPSSPLLDEVPKEEASFEIDVNTTSLQRSKSFHQRFYDDGKKFLVIFADGSGCCYYPSGNVAVLITTVDPGKYSYFAFKNKADYDFNDSGILGIFEPNGNTCCYFSDGMIRLVLSPYGGMQSDKYGSRKKRWLWNAGNVHSHTPPLHPICFSLNKHIAVRVKDQDDIVLTFACAQRSVRFNVGARLKPVKAIKMRAPEQSEHEQLLRDFKFNVGTLFNKIEMTLKFPKSPRLSKLSLPPHLGSRRKVKRVQSSLQPVDDKESAVVVN